MAVMVMMTMVVVAMVVAAVVVVMMAMVVVVVVVVVVAVECMDGLGGGAQAHLLLRDLERREFSPVPQLRVGSGHQEQVRAL